jgi:hypothetical protein
MNTIIQPRCVVSFALIVGLGVGLAAYVNAGTAPDFTFPRSTGRDTLRLSDYLEYPVLIVFFDPGNVAHARVSPYAREWNRRYHGDGLRTIGIHCPIFEPLKDWGNATTAIGRADIKFPVGLDPEWEAYNNYALNALPTFILLKPGGEIIFSASGTKSFTEIESAIQGLIKELKPGTIHPFVLEPLQPIDDPDAKFLEPTPMIVTGHASATIAGCDSAAFGRYETYTDSRDMQKGVIYLEGKWRVDEETISNEQRVFSLDEYMRIVYSGKDVWLLADIVDGRAPRIYVKQDRDFLPKEFWGRDVMSDQRGRPFIQMRYAVPVHVVSNSEFGAHELRLIPGQGNMKLYYLYFEGAVDLQKKSSK